MKGIKLGSMLDPPLDVWVSGKIKSLIRKFSNFEKCLGRLTKVCQNGCHISRTIWCKSWERQLSRDKACSRKTLWVYSRILPVYSPTHPKDIWQTQLTPVTATSPFGWCDYAKTVLWKSSCLNLFSPRLLKATKKLILALLHTFPRIISFLPDHLKFIGN